MMWFFRHFWIFISYHIFLLNQVEGAIAIPPSNSAPLPLFCPSVCPSIGLLTTFSGFCTFADKSLGRNGIELEMQMFPDDLPLANIDADGYCCHFMRSSVRPTIHGLGFVYCIQSAWKKWPTIWHADVSRWLTLSIHGCLWILLLVCLSVHLSVRSFTAFSGGCAFADKSLGTNGIKFDMLMYLLVIRPFEKRDVLCRGNVCPSVRPSVRPRFPDFSSTCFEISIWNLVYAFSRWHDMSSLSCITIGSIWPSLQPKVGQTYFLQSWPHKSR